MDANQNYHAYATVREDTAERQILHVFGEIDLSCAADFESAINDAMAVGGPLSVDLRECYYIDSSALSVLIRAFNRYGKSMETIIKENTVVARVIRISNLDEHLPISFTHA